MKLRYSSFYKLMTLTTVVSSCSGWVRVSSPAKKSVEIPATGGASKSSLALSLSDQIGIEDGDVTVSGEITGGSGNLKYTWSQVSGTAVTITSNSTSLFGLTEQKISTLQFTVPTLAADETMVFRLTVSDGSTSVSKDVNVKVYKTQTKLGIESSSYFDLWRGSTAEPTNRSLSELQSAFSKIWSMFLSQKFQTYENTSDMALVPASGQDWQAIWNPRVNGRYGQSQSLVGSKIIIFGGQDAINTYRNDVRSFDTTTNTWSVLKADDPSGVEDVDYPKRRMNHSQSSVGNKIIIFGGTDSGLVKRNDVWSFDTDAKTWAKLKADDPGGVVDTDYPKRRTTHSQSTIGKKVFVIGGSDGTRRNDVWSFDTDTNSWTKLKADDPAGVMDTDYPRRRQNFSASVIGNKILIFGGLDNGGFMGMGVKRNDVWSYDTDTNTWAKLKADDPGGVADTDYPKIRYMHSQASYGTKIIVFGGMDSTGLSRNDVWSFETVDNSWSKLKADNPSGTADINYPKARYYHTETVVDGKVVVYGGFDGSRRNDIWSFNLSDLNWSRLLADSVEGIEDTDYPKRRNYQTQSTVGNNLIVFGGYDSSSAYRNDVNSFNTTTTKWTRLKADDPAGVQDTDYPRRRYQHGQSTIGNNIIIVGGRDSALTARNDVWSFDTVNLTWSKLKADDPAGVMDTDYPRRRQFHAQSTVGTKVIIFGGFDSASAYRNDVWSFDTVGNTWTKLKADDPAGVLDTDYPKRRSQAAQSPLGTKVIIFGGYDGAVARNDVWAFDTADNSWTKLKANDPGGVVDVDYPKRRYNASASTIGTKVYLFGGYDGTNTRNDLWAFDTIDNSWTRIKADDSGGIPETDYPRRRYLHSQSLVGNKIFIYAGSDSGGVIKNDIWAIDPTSPSADNKSGVVVSFNLSGFNPPILYFNLFGYGSGDNNGSLGYGLNMHVWDESTNQWIKLGSNVASSRSSSSAKVSTAVDKKYLTSDKKIHFLISSKYGRTSSFESKLDVDLSSFQLRIPNNQ